MLFIYFSNLLNSYYLLYVFVHICYHIFNMEFGELRYFSKKKYDKKTATFYVCDSFLLFLYIKSFITIKNICKLCIILQRLLLFCKYLLQLIRSNCKIRIRCRRYLQKSKSICKIIYFRNCHIKRCGSFLFYKNRAFLFLRIVKIRSSILLA